jgi:hypothetical protein
VDNSKCKGKQFIDILVVDSLNKTSNCAWQAARAFQMTSYGEIISHRKKNVELNRKHRYMYMVFFHQTVF